LSELVLVGLNHRQAPVELRERLAFSEEEKAPFLGRLRDSGRARGAVLLSTCNRVELYADLDESASPRALEQALMEHRSFPPERRDLFYEKRGKEAVHHLFRVASGLDSMVLGEPQILGQVKEAYQLAREGGVVTTPLNLLFQKTFHVAKQVRTQTGIGERPVTISYAAFNLANQIFQDLTTKRILLLGAGEMSRILATHFVESGVREVRVANRTYERAVEFARPFGAAVVPWGEFPKALIQSDIVVASTGSQRPVVLRPMVETVMKLRRWSSLFVIDIAVPRDVEPEVGKLDGVYLYDIDDLQEVADEGLAERQKKASAAEAMIRSELDMYARFLDHAALSEAISSLVAWSTKIQDQEVEEALRRMGSLTPKQEELVRNTARRVVHKLLHSPITRLKRMVLEEDAAEALATFRELFPLDPPQEEPAEKHDGG
jgi:glutamyl-tRNA reductase